jgi:hypothetical protein
MATRQLEVRFIGDQLQANRTLLVFQGANGAGLPSLLVLVLPCPRTSTSASISFSTIAVLFGAARALVQGPVLYLANTAAIVHQLTPSTLFHQRLAFCAISTDLALGFLVRAFFGHQSERCCVLRASKSFEFRFLFSLFLSFFIWYRYVNLAGRTAA